MERIRHFTTVEQARNAAIKWLERNKVSFGPYHKVEIGRLGVLSTTEVGVSSTAKPFWRIRLDYDPMKGPHYNAEVGTGLTREKMAFAFEGTEDTVARLGRQPR